MLISHWNKDLSISIYLCIIRDCTTCQVEGHCLSTCCVVCKSVCGCVRCVFAPTHARLTTHQSLIQMVPNFFVDWVILMSFSIVKCWKEYKESMIFLLHFFFIPICSPYWVKPLLLWIQSFQVICLPKHCRQCCQTAVFGGLLDYKPIALECIDRPICFKQNVVCFLAFYHILA